MRRRRSMTATLATTLATTLAATLATTRPRALTARQFHELAPYS